MPSKKNFSYAFIPLVSFLLFKSNLAVSSPALKAFIPQKNISISYQVAPRLSQLLLDASLSVDYSIYSLGSALVQQKSNKNFIKKTKKNLLKSLKNKNEVDTINLYKILDKINFSYQEDLSLDLEKIQLNTKIDPIISGSYQLFLPRRPNHIRLIDPNTSDKIIKIEIKPGYNLKKYLKEYKNNLNITTTENINIIQADKKLVIPKLSYWTNHNYYLSPGAIIFIGLNKNTEENKKINENVSKLLQNHVVY